MSGVIDVLDRSAALVEGWGAAVLPDGRTLSQALTIDGLSLWDVIAVDLAVYLVPEALLPARGRRPWHAAIRSILGGVRARLQNAPPRRLVAGCPSAGAPTFLLLGFSGYLTRDVLAPVAARLAAAGDQARIIIDHTTDVTATASRGRDHEAIWAHWDATVRSDYRHLRAWLSAQTSRLAHGGIAQAIREHDRSLWPEMKPVFEFILHRHLPNLLGHLAVARHHFAAHKPQVVISPDVADPRTRIYWLLANARRIPTLHIVYGDIFGRECIEWRFLWDGLVAAAGERTRDMITLHGVPAGMVSVTGSVRHDGIVHTSPADRISARRELGIDGTQVMVLFASTVALTAYDGIRNRESLMNTKAAILAATDALAGARTIVKPHPLENVQETRRLAAGARRLVFVDRRLDIRTLTIACDVFITLGSSATVGALITRKLVLYPVFDDSIYWDDQFLHSGAVLVVRSREELAAVLHIAANGGIESLLAPLEEARQRFLQAWAFQPDGQAAERIASLARRLVPSAPA